MLCFQRNPQPLTNLSSTILWQQYTPSKFYQSSSTTPNSFSAISIFIYSNLQSKLYHLDKVVRHLQHHYRNRHKFFNFTYSYQLKSISSIFKVHFNIFDNFIAENHHSHLKCLRKILTINFVDLYITRFWQFYFKPDKICTLINILHVWLRIVATK